MQILLGFLIMVVGYAAALVYLPLQVYAAVRLRGGRRLAALLPLLLMVPIFALTADAYAKDSNLWPVCLIFTAPVGTGYLVALLLIRRSAASQSSAEFVSPAKPGAHDT
ncbi:MAG TPA: hypothetical protein VFA18_08215 [Gemmataceae bacterium]|nr:hypothetical protein [Gemmataceae bacterium]